MQTANISWLWKKSAKRKHVAMLIDDSGVLEVRTPLRIKQQKVEAIILEKLNWIEKSMNKQIQRIHPKFPEFSPSGTLYIFGEKQNFEVLDSKRGGLSFEDDKLIIKANSERHFKNQLQKFYLEQTKTIVESSLDELTSKLKKPQASVGYRYYKSRWGSCDRNNNLMFNALLSLHKKEHVHYVVAHELAHIKEKNHSKAFYDEGERLLAGFRQFQKEMRN